MNQEERERYMREFARFSDELLADRESAAKFLQDAGIHDDNGKLTERYERRGNKILS